MKFEGRSSKAGIEYGVRRLFERVDDLLPDSVEYSLSFDCLIHVQTLLLITSDYLKLPKIKFCVRRPW